MSTKSHENEGLSSNTESSPSKLTGVIRNIFGSITLPFISRNKEEKSQETKSNESLSHSPVSIKKNTGQVPDSESTNIDVSRENKNTITEASKTGPISLPLSLPLSSNTKNLNYSDESDIEITAVSYPNRNRSKSFSGQKEQEVNIPVDDQSSPKPVSKTTVKTNILHKKSDILPPDLSEQRVPKKRRKFKSFECNKKHLIINPSSESDHEITLDSSFNNLSSPSKPAKPQSESLQPAKAQNTATESNKFKAIGVETPAHVTPTPKETDTSTQNSVYPKMQASQYQSNSPHVEYLGSKSSFFRAYETQLRKEIEDAERSELEISLAELQAGMVNEEDLFAEIDEHFRNISHSNILGEQGEQGNQEPVVEEEHYVTENPEPAIRKESIDLDDEVISSTQKSRNQTIPQQQQDLQVIEIDTQKSPINLSKEDEGNASDVDDLISSQKAAEDSQQRTHKLSAPTGLINESINSNSSSHVESQESPIRNLQVHSLVADATASNEAKSTPSKPTKSTRPNPFEQQSPLLTQEYADLPDTDNEKQKIKNRKRRKGAQRKLLRLQRKGIENDAQPKTAELEVKNSNPNKDDTNKEAHNSQKQDLSPSIVHNMQSPPSITVPIPISHTFALSDIFPIDEDQQQMGSSPLEKPEPDSLVHTIQPELSARNEESTENKGPKTIDEIEAGLQFQDNPLAEKIVEPEKDSKMSAGGSEITSQRVSSPKSPVMHPSSPQLSLPLPESYDERPEIIIISSGSSSRGSVVSVDDIEELKNLQGTGLSQFPNDSMDIGSTVIPNSSQSIQASQRHNPLTSQIAVNSSQESHIDSSIASLNQNQGYRPISNTHRRKKMRTSPAKVSEQVKPKEEPSSRPRPLFEILKENFDKAGTKFTGFDID